MKPILFIVFLSLLNLSCTPGKTEADLKAEKSYAMLEEHCFRCHNSKKKKGKIDLESFASIKAPLKNIQLWRHALTMAEEKTMPPENKKQPTEEERQEIISWIKGTLKDTYEQMPDDPGRTVVRKLNRTEYKNTLNDLLYIDEDHSADIPLDSVGYGFDNIADLLNIPPILMEKYLTTARIAIDKAIWENPNPKMSLRIGAEEFSKVAGAGDISPTQAGLYSNGTIKTDFTIKHDNKYKLTINAYGTQAGNEAVKADIKVDGKKIKTIDIKNKSYKPGDFSLTLDLKKGKRTLEITFINDHYDAEKKQDRNLFVKHVNVNGPLGKIDLPKSHTSLISNMPENGQNEDSAAIQNIKSFLQRAFRKNVTDEELTPYVNLYTKERKSGRTFYQALKTSYMAALVSPNFLFRMEKQPENTVKADNYELAVRLSYFLHSSMPDEQLLSIAALGELNNPKVFKSEVERLLKSPRLTSFSENFSGQWLMLRSLDRLQPDKKQFPEWNNELKDSMKNEAVTLFHTILSNNDSIQKFISNEDIYINETLAKHYGIPNIKGKEIRSIKAPANRGGILTMSSTLAVTSMPARTSPVKRGKWIMEEVLGTPPPEPPEDISPLEETGKANPNMSLREKLELHRADEGCASCHRIMDVYGFCFENFDPMGKWRNTENGRPIETGGTLPDGTKLEGLSNLKEYIISKDENFAEHLISKLLIYALGRGLEESDYKTISSIVSQTKKDGYRFQDIILAITESVPFQMKKP
ncbi:MAG: DUF1592 domain-containing protein [Lentisphaeraceae bacterium]|nr:DUF1592 domain-containing protein [Lentisphaeraceae bacterium]